MQFFLLKRCLQMTTTFVCKPSSFAENYLANLKRQTSRKSLFIFSTVQTWKEEVLWLLKSHNPLFHKKLFFATKFLHIFIFHFCKSSDFFRFVSNWTVHRNPILKMEFASTPPKGWKTIQRLKVSFSDISFTFKKKLLTTFLLFL